jgi:hypothetical protein
MKIIFLNAIKGNYENRFKQKNPKYLVELIDTINTTRNCFCWFLIVQPHS